jgi:serine/threonine protein kinase
MIGQSIAHYKILEKLGEGGMGVVYKAQDTKLDRIVALKFLPQHLHASEEEKARFLQEAKAAATLNHPNVCTIYDIKEEEGKNFIVMEFVDGVTLREKFVENAIPPKEAVTYAIQIGEALEEAHSKGIVHRDIKSDNIMVNKKNQIKVMDFGLAKLKGSLKLTKATSTVGTLGYMAPEQIQGGETDARSDIFSFGVVLFEMLTRRLPFRGEHDAALMYSILNEEPESLQKFLPEASHELIHLLGISLEKQREERYQTVTEMVRDLRRAQKQTSRVSRIIDTSTLTAEKPEAQPSKPSFLKNRSVMLTSAAVLLVIVSLATYFLVFRGTSGVAKSFSLQDMQITRITSTGKARQAAISPDGRLIVYSERDKGKQSLWVRQVATGSNIQILPPADVTYQGITISADGNYAFYSQRDEKTGISALFQLPVLGGTPRKLLEDIRNGVTISPDKKRLAFARSYSGSGEFSILTANIDGTGEKVLASHKADHWFDFTPAWSADGSTIAAALGSYTGGIHYSVVALEPTDGSEKPLSAFRWFLLDKMQWFSDGSGILMSGGERSASMEQLWKLSYPSGDVQRVTNDLNNYDSFDLTADSRSVCVVQSDIQMSLDILPGGNSEAARRITQGKLLLSDFSWTPNGKILYTQGAAERWKLYLMERDGSQQRPVTVDEFDEYTPRMTPDGKTIVYVSHRSGIPNLWRVGLDGTNPVQITTGGEDYRPSISPDGKWVVFDSWDLGPNTVMKVSIDGGEPVRISEKNGSGASISPDGKLIAYLTRDEQKAQERSIVIVQFENGKQVKSIQFSPTGGRQIVWMPDGKSLMYQDNRGGVSNIWAQPLVGGPPRQITHFQSELIISYDWSPDGKYLGVVRSSTTSDVLLMTNTSK